MHNVPRPRWFHRTEFEFGNLLVTTAEERHVQPDGTENVEITYTGESIREKIWQERFYNSQVLKITVNLILQISDPTETSLLLLNSCVCPSASLTSIGKGETKMSRTLISGG